MPVTVLKNEDGYKLMKVSHSGEDGSVIREHHVIVDPDGELVQVGMTRPQADALLRALTVDIEARQMGASPVAVGQ
ncbi:hypothetical protein [Marinobacter bohaiensis]|uniref:hypothetical protein n=1 Tax=Marinobacter bohaiensis TaxID=2201898 RepID=UPI000DAC6652|nr:hypothetical protein [Marinobacter bohaiensis]